MMQGNQEVALNFVSSIVLNKQARNLRENTVWSIQG